MKNGGKNKSVAFIILVSVYQLFAPLLFFFCEIFSIICMQMPLGLMFCYLTQCILNVA